MINLIKNEFIKIFHKKSIIVLLIVVLGFITLNNVLYKVINSVMKDNDFTADEVEIQNALNEEEKKSSEYIELKTQLDLNKLLNKYKNSSWKSNIINEKMYDILYGMNKYSIQINDKNQYKEFEKQYNYIINILNNNDWKKLAIEDKKALQIELDNLNKSLKDKTSNKSTINKQIFEIENKIERLNIRLDKNIVYGNDYLNIALEGYQVNSITYEEFVKQRKDEPVKLDEFKLKLQYNNLIKENAIDKYILDTKIDVNETKSNRYQLLTLNDQYSLLVIIIIIIISGTIISSEFDKGTIKLLLIRPYSRTKILLSKYIVSLLMIIISMIVISLLQTIIGGIILGFDSLNIPAIIYDYNNNSVITIKIFKYVIISLGAVLPKYILLSTLAFAISTIFTNSSLGIIFPILGNFGSNIINIIAKDINIPFMQYFITLNWDFNQYLYGAISPYKNVNLMGSILICIIYLLIMLLPTFIIFNKKNIKNI